MSSRSLGSLLLGVALGSGAVWSFQHLRAPAAVASSGPRTVAKSSASVASGAGSETPVAGPALILPEPLAGAEADAALEAFLALPKLAKDAPAAEVQDRVERLRALLTLLPDSHFERLLTAFGSRAGEAEATVRRAAFDIWCERAAPAAARWALAVSPGEAINASARSRYVTLAVNAWARDDFAAAWTWSGALGDAGLRKSIIPGLLSQLAATDTQKALSLVPADDEELGRAARRSIFQAWSKRDPVAAIQSLGATLLEQRGQEWPVQQALVKWAAKDPAAAIAWAAAQPTPDGESYRSLLNNIGWYVTETPASVRPFVEALASRADLAGRDSALQNIVGPWIQKDSKAALDWLDGVQDVALRSDLVSRSLGYVDMKKPDQFLELIKRLPASDARDEQVAQRLGDWAKKDPDAALAWISDHQGPEIASASRKVEGVLLGNLAATDPQAAIARLQAMPADAARGEVAVQLAQAWAKSDPAAAARWFAQQLPSDSSKNRGGAPQAYQLGQIAAGWVTRDPLGYVDWAQSLPQGMQRDQAFNALANAPWSYNNDDVEPPPRAGYANKLAQIKDPALRDRALIPHLSHWMRSDRQAARNWIETNDALSPEAAARLLTSDDRNN